MNSVHEQCPNNDPKQCTVSKLGWVHSVHTQNPGRAHTACAVPMSWALLRTQQACRAHVARAASAGRAHAGRALVATRPGSLPPGRDLTSVSRHQGGQNHVATSNRCRDTTQNAPGRDLKTGSRHQTSSMQPEPCRDIKSVSRHHPSLSRSRHQNQVATLLEVTICRDTVSAHSGLSRSRHRNPCRDLPHCHPCRDIKSMSRRRFLLTKADQVATPLPGCDLMPNQTQSYPQPGCDTNSSSPVSALHKIFFFFFFFKSSNSLPATSKM